MYKEVGVDPSYRKATRQLREKAQSDHERGDRRYTSITNLVAHGWLVYNHELAT